MGVRVPEDLSIVGVDDSVHAEYACPPLTTVRLPTQPAAEAAAERMLAIVAKEANAEKAEHLEFKGTLVVRGSTAPPRTMRNAE